MIRRTSLFELGHARAPVHFSIGALNGSIERQSDGQPRLTLHPRIGSPTGRIQNPLAPNEKGSKSVLRHRRWVEQPVD